MMLRNSCRYLLVQRTTKSVCRRLVSEAKIQEPENVAAKPKRRRKPDGSISIELKIPKDMSSHFTSPEQKELLQTFPQKLVKKVSKTEGFYMASEEPARLIADVLKKDLQPHQTLIEVNPGKGFITRHLLEETKNNIVLYEPLDVFIPQLSSMIGEYPERDIVLKPLDFNSVWRMAFIDKLENGHRLDEALKGIGRAEYEAEPNARLFSMTSSLSFLKHIINSIIFQSSLMSCGRCELYLCLPPPLFFHLTCSKQAGYLMYRASSVLFQILFEYEFVCKISRKELLPWLAEPKQGTHMKMSRYSLVDPDSMYLMKAVPRRDLYTHCLPENLPTLWFFVKQHFVSRTNRVIPTLERWIPSCGPRLIVNTKRSSRPDLINPEQANNIPMYFEPCRHLSTEDFVENINIFTEFGDLTPSQVLTLFDQFVSWSEYKESSFGASLENTLMKMHSSPDEGSVLPEEEECETDIETKISPNNLEN